MYDVTFSLSVPEMDGDRVGESADITAAFDIFPALNVRRQVAVAWFGFPEAESWVNVKSYTRHTEE